MRIISTLILTLFLSSCSVIHTIDSLELLSKSKTSDLSELDEGNILLIGKVKVVMEYDYQKPLKYFSYVFENSPDLNYGDNVSQLISEHALRFDKLDTFFTFEVPKEDRFIIQAFGYDRYEINDLSYNLPAKMQYTPVEGAKAIYIGDVTYHLDLSYLTTRVTVEDNFDAANQLFVEKFGSEYALSKSLLEGKYIELIEINGSSAGI